MDKLLNIRPFMKFLVFLIISASTYSAVWENRNQWNQNWEVQHKEWIRKKLKSDIFTKGKYKGIKTDCADAVYSTRAIFAFENQLPFVITNTLGGWRKSLSNSTKSFDQIEDPVERFIAFINNLGDIVSTLSLAYNDTFPVDIAFLSPGDNYVTVNRDNSRHAYIIKDLSETGYFHLLYSNVPRGVRKLTSKKGLPTPLFKEAPFGFKRFKWPTQIENPDIAIPAERGYGLDQYRLRKEYTFESSFFGALTRLLRTKVESIKEKIDRTLENVKVQLEFRRQIVKETHEYKKEIDGRCLTQEEYYNYSTPSRDLRIINEINSLKEPWLKAKQAGLTFAIDEKYRLAMDYLIGDDLSEEAGKKFESLLKFKYRKGIFRKKKINLKDFYEGIQNGNVSSNPNDTFMRRWGHDLDKPTPCLDQREIISEQRTFHSAEKEILSLEKITHFEQKSSDTYILKEAFDPNGQRKISLFKIDKYGFPIQQDLNFEERRLSTQQLLKKLQAKKKSVLYRNEVKKNNQLYLEERIAN